MEEQSDMPSWWRCDTHGPGTRTAWGCPECVRELRTSLATATRERDEARISVAMLWAAAKLAESALADIGDSDHEPTDDLAWCELRAQRTLPVVRFALAATEPKP